MTQNIKESSSIPMPVLYKNLAHILKEKGIDYILIAKKLNISIECFYKKLAGKRPFYLNEVLKIRELLNCEFTIDYLFRE